MPMRAMMLGAVALAGAGWAAVPAGADEPAPVSGFGGTLPAPLYAAWAKGYAHDGGSAVSYAPVGTGKALGSGLGSDPQHFIASDAGLSATETRGLAEVPVAVGGIVPVVNLPGLDPGEVVVDGPALARLLAGVTQTWDAPDLARLNPHVPLPTSPSRWCTAPTRRAPPTCWRPTCRRQAGASGPAGRAAA